LSSLVAVLKVDLVFSLLQELLAASPRRDMFFCSRQWLFATSSLVSQADQFYRQSCEQVLLEHIRILEQTL
jgi:hypothetical protein